MRVCHAAKVGLPLLALFVAGCSETKLAVSSVKQIGRSPVNTLPEATTPLGTYKVGKPYQIKDRWYYPRVDYQYRETGIASWYGPKFHGKKTANGAIFDMNLVSAAHRVLPMPSKVRVTNLENGRALDVVVNDRGPFAHGRIIDMSRRAAQLLGFERQGTAKVLVEVLSDESRRLAIKAPPKPTSAEERASVSAAPQGNVGASSLPGTTGLARPVNKRPVPIAVAAKVAPSKDPEQVDQKLVSPTQIFIQLGAFSVPANADRLRASASRFGNTVISPVSSRGKVLYRVRLGPIASIEQADRNLAKLLQAGFEGSRVVVDCSRGC